MTMRGDLIFLGLLYPLIGVVAATVTLGGTLLPLFFPIAAGISLLGPIVAIGFYELARRREDGLESDWSHFFDVRKRPSAEGIGRSEEHTSELQSLMRISYAVFCLKKKTQAAHTKQHISHLTKNGCTALQD